MESKKKGEKSEFIPGFQNVDEFSQKGFKAMVEATRAFQVLPKKPSPVWDLRTTYSEFNRGLKQSRARIITSLTKLLQHSKFSPHDFRKLDVEDKFDFIVDSNDELLERISTSLDQAEGLFKRAQTFVVNPNAPPAAASGNPPGTWKEKKLIRLNSAPATPSEAASSSSSFTTAEQTTSCNNSSSNSTPISNAEMARKIKKARYTNRVREKPQLKFTRLVDNSPAPFIPTLFDKPHSIKPLSILPEYNENNEEFYGHPYQIEINQWKPLPHMIEPSTLQYPPDMNQTPFLYVENPRDMEKMLAHLGDASEIAVDVEHHSYRSFLGITCLIQISTRTHDYVIDGLALRDQMHNLNEIFANPKILKIFHSANSDIEWLQKDYSVYVVGLFDTAIAAKLLNFSQISLQYLLSEICGTSTNKGFQLADWRIRPIPPEMLQYARMDTHFLLYIYDVLKNRLIENGNEMDNLLNAMYERSRAVCLKRYEKPINNPQVALRKSRRSFNNRQLYCFTELFKWRDQIAREKDESLGYVLPNHMLLTMAESLPKEMTGIMACCDPVPPLVHSNVGLIHRIVLKARELPIHDVNETSMQNKSQKKGKEQKNWLLMMNSMYEVDLNEHGIENQSSSGFEGEFASDWWKSIDWSNLKSKNVPTISFNASRSKSKSTNNENNKSLKATPYQRYRITNEIMEKLRDPKKKEELDLENPIVKSVLETILLDPNAQENQEEEETRPAPSIKPLFDQEFVPFNPMSTPVKEKGKGKKRKRANNINDISQEEEEKKPRMTENYNDNVEEEGGGGDDNEVKPTVGILGVGDEDMPIILSDDESDHSNIQYNNKKTPQKSNRSHDDTPQNKKNRNKKRNKNFLKKLANKGKKRKYDVQEAEQEQQLENEKSTPQNLEDGEIQEKDDDDNNDDIVEISPSPSNTSKQHNNKNQKKNFDHRQNNYKNNRGNNNNNNKFDKTNGQSSHSSNNKDNNSNNQSPRGRGKGGGNRGGKKKNFWNFKDSGKSITFK